MTLLDSLILGIVEGLTEFLPISSTAHLEFTARLLGVAKTDFAKSFEVIIQFGAILAIVVLYWRRVTLRFGIWKKVLAAFIPTGIVGFALYSFIKGYLLGNSAIAAWALLLGGIALIVTDLVAPARETDDTLDEIERMPYRTAALVGLAQSVAVIPGVSRAGATIVAGLALGVSRRSIVEFSFLLAVPTMFAAAGYDLLKNAHLFATGDAVALGLGFVVSFITAILGVKFFLALLERRSFLWFGLYRIVLGLAALYVLMSL